MTADVTPLEAPGAPPLYACLLNAQGRHLHDLFLHRMHGGRVGVGVGCEWSVLWQRRIDSGCSD